MKLLVVLLASVVLAVADPVLENPIYGYLEKHAIPLAEKIRKAEEEYNAQQKIVGGVTAVAGQYPWQAGLIIDMVGLEGRGICGASLISNQRLITAAHCWFDGIHQAWRVTAVLGSSQLFSGGTRLETSVVVAHPNWFPLLVRNDVAIIYLPSPVVISNLIAPVSLPTGDELNEDFAGELAIASGFGLTADGSNIALDQSLSHVKLHVISNKACSWAFPLILQDSNVCTSGLGSVGVCQGDSGSPLVVSRGERNILIGVTSFGSSFGCESFLPSAFSRVTSFMSFINQHI